MVVAKNSGTDYVFMFFIYLFLILVTVIILYPLIYIISASISDSEGVYSGRMWLWPVNINFLAFESVFSSRNIGQSYLNTIIITITGTLYNLFLTFLAAYPLARKDFKMRAPIMAVFVFTMLFHGGLIPHYLLVKDLGILDTWFSLILPVGISVWNLILMKTYIESTIPFELYEAASIDGCSDFFYMTRITLPLSKTIIAVLALYYGVFHWNSYFSAMLYIKTASKYPLQIILRNILILYQMDQGMNMDGEMLAQLATLAQTIRYAVIVAASLPLLVAYPFLQKYFVKGVMIGSLKG